MWQSLKPLHLGGNTDPRVPGKHKHRRQLPTQGEDPGRIGGDVDKDVVKVEDKNLFNPHSHHPHHLR